MREVLIPQTYSFSFPSYPLLIVRYELVGSSRNEIRGINAIIPYFAISLPHKKLRY